MAVREFLRDAPADDLITSVGTISGMTHGTVGFIVKLLDVTDFNDLFYLHDSGGSNIGGVGVDDSSSNVYWWDGSTNPGGPSLAVNVWLLVIARKATGTATARFSVYNYSTDTWSHSNASGTTGNFTAPGVSGDIRFSFESTFGLCELRIALRAAWSNSLPWAANSTGDAAIEAAGLEISAANWDAAVPDMGQLFNQAATTTAVEDWTGNGADQTSISGTTVITVDDPPGFSFDLGGDQDLNIPFHQQTNSIFPLTVQNQNPLDLEVPFHGSEAQLFTPSVVNQSPLELNVPRHESEVQIFAPTLSTGDKQLAIPFFQNTPSFFAPVVENQSAQNLNVGFITSTDQLFLPSLTSQINVELNVPFFQNVALLFTPTVFNEGEELFEPTLVGNGTLADRIMAGLIDQGFLTGTIVDREYTRLLAKLSLTAPQPKSLDDLYSMAGEENRILGIGVDELTPA